MIGKSLQHRHTVSQLRDLFVFFIFYFILVLLYFICLTYYVLKGELNEHFDSYSHIHCMKVAIWVKLKRCLPMKFSLFKTPHCCSVTYKVANCFRWSRPNVTHFMPNAFIKYQIISVHRKYGVNLPRTVERALKRILWFSYIYPKFHLSFS